MLNPNFSWQQPSSRTPPPKVTLPAPQVKSAPRQSLSTLHKGKKDSGCDFIAEVDNEDNDDESWDTQNEESDNSSQATGAGHDVKEIKGASSTSHNRKPTARGRRDRRLLRRPALIPYWTEKESHPQPPPPGRKEPRRRSVANNQRIQEIIHNKKVHPLATCVQDSSADDSDAPNSPNYAVTPWEEFDRPKSKLPQATSYLRQDNEKFQLTPIEADLGVLAVLAGMPERSPSTKSRLSAISKFRSRNPSLIELPGGSVIAVITPEQSAFQRSVYLPGKTVIDNHSYSPSNFNLTPLDLLQETTTANTGDFSRRKSEDAMVDDIVHYFEEFGSGFDLETLNTGLDTFWNNPPAKTPPTITKVDWPRPASWTLKTRQRGVPSDFDSLPGETFAVNFNSFDLGMPDLDDGLFKDEYHEYKKKKSIARSSLRAEAFEPAPDEIAPDVIPELAPDSAQDSAQDSAPDSAPESAGPVTSEPPSRAPSNLRRSKLGKKRASSGSPRISSFRRLLQSASTIV